MGYGIRTTKFQIIIYFNNDIGYLF